MPAPSLFRGKNPLARARRAFARRARAQQIAPSAMRVATGRKPSSYVPSESVRGSGHGLAREQLLLKAAAGPDAQALYWATSVRMDRVSGVSVSACLQSRGQLIGVGR